MRELIEEAWTAFAGTMASALVPLVLPSIPILFFGDSDAYRRSPLRVITVGLNPSREEFPTEDPFLRFPAARRIAPGLELDDARVYLCSLKNYYRTRPYSRWFDGAYGAMLHGLGASYYEGAKNTALHTDLLSPLATDPTWSGLRSHERRVLTEDGVSLWHKLVEHLQPDIVLLSVKSAYRGEIRFPVVEDLGVIHRIERENPYDVWGCRRRLASGKRPLFVFGRAAQLPFGTISKDAKLEVGRRVRELHAG